MTDPLWIVAVLAAMIVVSEVLARRGLFRHLGSALLVIVLTAVVANFGLIPTVSEGSPVFDVIFSVVGPLAIFWLLLGVHLRTVLKAGPMMIGLFLVGSLGTLLGVLAGIWLAGGEAAFGPRFAALGGMFVGTYTGGSINFNAVALEYGVMEEPVLFAGAAVVDSLMTTIWMVATVVLPRWLGRLRVGGGPRAVSAEEEESVLDEEQVSAVGLALLLALGASTLWLSNHTAVWLEQSFGVAVPSILILTTVALGLAQLPVVRSIGGTHVVGWFAVMLFLAAIGALCDVGALARLGALAPALSILVGVTVAVHGLLVFGLALVLRLDIDAAAVASQANIGGSTSALALARSLDRSDLALPAILVGALGNALGTYLGFLAAALLGV